MSAPQIHRWMLWTGLLLITASAISALQGGLGWREVFIGLVGLITVLLGLEAAESEEE